MSGSFQRLMSMTSPLGAGALLPVRLQAHEAISEAFAFTLGMTSARNSIDANDMLFKPVCVTLTFQQPTDLPPRHFHGLVRSFTATGGVGLDAWGYEAELVPALWFLRQTADCRIWQKMTAIDVIKTIFTEAGITGVEWNVSGSPPVRETITQFNETDFDFVSRLLEEEGCFYFFKHTDSAHTLVVADANTAFKDAPKAQAMQTGKGAGYTHIDAWKRMDRTGLGTVAILDYDPEKPRTLVKADDKTLLKAAGADMRDEFAWPALTLKVDVAKTRARFRIQAADAAATLMDGAGTHPQFSPGCKFTVPDDSIASYVLRSVIHSAVDESQQRTGAAATEYHNSFSAFPAATTWRQKLSVPRPRMVGIHTAVVIGPDGQEIYTDKFGRIQVQFYWDHRADAKPQQDICWVRVIQPWVGSETGSDWGWQHLPRVGTEVAVSFMDGDPDRPVVVGCFYNGVAMPLFALPDNKTKSGMRTRSSTKGGGSDYSEFSFEDLKGSELVFLHAQKDYLTEVEHDQTLKVDNCRIVTIKVDETIDIGGKRTTTVKNNDQLTLTLGDLSITTKQGKMTIVAQSDHSLESKMGNISTKADMGNIDTQASLGNISAKAAVGAVTIEALQSITLKCGPTSLVLDPMGITLKGMNITIKGDLMASMEGGLMTTVKAGAMLTLKGAIVMLN